MKWATLIKWLTNILMTFWKFLKYSKDSARILYYFVVLQCVKMGLK